MKIGLIGAGEMGLAMGGHVLDKGYAVTAFDLNPQRLEEAEKRGLQVAASLEELARNAEVYIVAVATDEQVIAVSEVLSANGPKGAVIVITATIAPETMRDLAPRLAGSGVHIIDAPVVYGAAGARQGNLLSLCGGDAGAIDKVTPALMCYSREVVRVGPIGAGQVAKACNNLLHWVHAVSNFESLLIAKRYGLDPQWMREVLMKCPAKNGTLERFDSSRFTWQEKDMDITMDAAQKLGLMLPLSGQVDQLVKALKASDVSDLLYGEEATYLGLKVRALSADEGGLA